MVASHHWFFSFFTYAEPGTTPSDSGCHTGELAMDKTDSSWADRMDVNPDQDVHPDNIPDWAMMRPTPNKEIPPPGYFPPKNTWTRKQPPSDKEIPLPWEDTQHPLSKYPIPSKLSHKLSRRKYLREKLLRMEHHVKYVKYCERKKKIHKGL